MEIGQVTSAELQRAAWAPEDADRFLIERGIGVRNDHMWVDSLQEDAGRKAFRLTVKVSAIDIRLQDVGE